MSAIKAWTDVFHLSYPACVEASPPRTPSSINLELGLYFCSDVQKVFMQNLIHCGRNNNLSQKNGFNLISYESFYACDEKLISKTCLNKSNLCIGGFSDSDEKITLKKFYDRGCTFL